MKDTIKDPDQPLRILIGFITQAPLADQGIKMRPSYFNTSHPRLPLTEVIQPRQGWHFGVIQEAAAAATPCHARVLGGTGKLSCNAL